MNNNLVYKKGDNARVVLFDNNLLRFALVQEKDDPGVLKLPGGSLMNGETPLRGIQRELEEELGEKLKLSSSDFAGQLKTTDGKYDRYIFTVSCDAKDLIPSDEIAQIDWLEPIELPDTKHKQHILEAVELALHHLRQSL